MMLPPRALIARHFVIQPLQFPHVAEGKARTPLRVERKSNASKFAKNATVRRRAAECPPYLGAVANSKHFYSAGEIANVTVASFTGASSAIPRRVGFFGV